MSKRAPTKTPISKPVHLASLSDDESSNSSISDVSDYSNESDYSDDQEDAIPLKKTNVAKKPDPKAKGKGKNQVVEPSPQKKIASKPIVHSPVVVDHEHIGTTSSGLEIYHSSNGYYCLYTNEMNDSFSRTYGPGQLLINGTVFNNPSGKCSVLIDLIPLIFEQNSYFTSKHYNSILQFINDQNLNRTELPGIMINSRSENPSSKFHGFKKCIFDETPSHFVSVVGAFYDPEHDTIVVTSGQIKQINQSSRYWLCYTFLMDDENYGQSAVDAIDNFLTKNFAADKITKYIYVPNNVWIDDYDNMVRILNIVVLTTMVSTMAPILEAKLVESMRRRDEILAKQAEDSKIDEELPKDMPSKATESFVNDTEAQKKVQQNDSEVEDDIKPKHKNRPAPVESDEDKPKHHKSGQRKRK